MDTLSKLVCVGLGRPHPRPVYPPDHKPGMAITKGGSMCANCRFYAGENRCRNEYFIEWNFGSDVIPRPADEYCSDWWDMP